MGGVGGEYFKSRSPREPKSPTFGVARGVLWGGATDFLFREAEGGEKKKAFLGGFCI